MLERAGKVFARFFTVLFVLIGVPGAVFASCSTPTAITAPTANGDIDPEFDIAALFFGSNDWNVSWSQSQPMGLAGGDAVCSSVDNGTTQGQTKSSVTANASYGANCWCKLTKWRQVDVSGTAYVFHSKIIGTGNDSCSSNCKTKCANLISTDASFRSIVFSGAKGCDAGNACADGYAIQSVVVNASNANTSSFMYNSLDGSTHTDLAYGSAGDWWYSFNDTDPFGYNLTLSYVPAYGTAVCTSTDGQTLGATSNSNFTNSTSGNYCWCKPTYYNYSPVTAPWVYVANTTSSLTTTVNGNKITVPVMMTGSGGCQRYCSARCGSALRVLGFNGSITSTSCVKCPDASGFYTGTSGTTVPTVDNSSISSTGGAVTTCYAKSATTFHDEAGSFTFSSNCNWSN